jgi:hypothetical protein
MNNRHGAQRKRMRKYRRWLVHDAGCVFCARFARTRPDYARESAIEARNEGARIPRSFRRHLK